MKELAQVLVAVFGVPAGVYCLLVSLGVEIGTGDWRLASAGLILIALGAAQWANWNSIFTPPDKESETDDG